MSEWSHLANAKHIDLIIAHAKANPKAWNAAVRDAAWDASLASVMVAAAWDAAATSVNDAAWYAAWGAANDAAWAAWGAVLALVAWNHAGDLMDSSAEQVKVLAILGDRAALLMYPAIATMETTQELV